MAQSRKHLPMALAATEPERAVREIEALERAAPADGLPAALLAEARAQTFIRLVNAGAYEEAERLAPGIARQTDRSRTAARSMPRRLDSLYCLGMLALHRERPERSRGAVRTRPPACGGAHGDLRVGASPRGIGARSSRGGAGLMLSPFSTPSPAAGDRRTLRRSRRAALRSGPAARRDRAPAGGAAAFPPPRGRRRLPCRDPVQPAPAPGGVAAPGVRAVRGPGGGLFPARRPRSFRGGRGTGRRRSPGGPRRRRRPAADRPRLPGRGGADGRRTC